MNDISALTRLLTATILLWQCSLIRADQMQPATPFVLGYANKLSVLPGEEISFHLSASSPLVNLVIARVGAQRTEVFKKDGIQCATQTIPDRAFIAWL